MIVHVLVLCAGWIVWGAEPGRSWMVRETVQEAAVASRENTEGSAGLSGGASVEKRRAEAERSQRKGVTVEVGVVVSKGRCAWRRGGDVRGTVCPQMGALEAC